MVHIQRSTFPTKHTCVAMFLTVQQCLMQHTVDNLFLFYPLLLHIFCLSRIKSYVIFTPLTSPQSVPWLRCLASGMSPWRSRFNIRPVPVECEMDSVALKQVSFQLLHLDLSASFHKCTILIHSQATDAILSQQMLLNKKHTHTHLSAHLDMCIQRYILLNRKLFQLCQQVSRHGEQQQTVAKRQ